jgi:uncharacterized protein YegL
MASLVTENIENTNTIQFNTNTFYENYDGYDDDKLKKVIMSISYKGTEIKSDTEIKSNNIFYIVLDTSGSMQGNPIIYCKNTIEFIINNLKKKDKICIITFNSDVDELISLTNINEENKERLIKKVNNIECSGCTNLSGGLFESIALIKEQNTESNTIYNIILLTDGIMNTGVKDDDQLIEILTSKVNSLLIKPNIYTFGYSNNHKSSLLNDISSNNNGLYKYIEKEDDIPKFIGECIGGLNSCIALNISITCKLNKQIELIKFYNLDKKLIKTEEDKYKINMGDCFSEEEKYIIMELNVSNISRENIDKYELMEIFASYTNLITNKDEELKIKSYIFFDKNENKINQYVLKNYIRVLYCEYYQNPDNLNVDEYISKIKKISENCINKDDISEYIEDLNNEKKRKEQNEEISHEQMSRYTSFATQRSGNYTNSQSLEYGQRIVETQDDSLNTYYNNGNDADDDNYNFDGINSQYYDDDDDDDILKQNLTVTQHPNKKQRR